MVLSNKKLKRKFRGLLAESAAAAEASSTGDLDGELQSVKELLSAKARRKPKTPKREKPPPPASGEDPEAEGLGEETEEGNGAIDVKEGDAKEAEEGGKVDEREEEAVDGTSDEKKVEERIEIEESESRKVYVRGIPFDSSKKDIKRFFKGCGALTEVDCLTFPDSGEFRGIAILTFETEAAARSALALDGADMGGFFLKIQPYRAQWIQKSDIVPNIVEDYVYVGNLSQDITEDDLRKLFSDCKIASIIFGKDKWTGKFKDYAHVDFKDTASMMIALKLDQKVVCGRPVKIKKRRKKSRPSGDNWMVKEADEETQKQNGATDVKDKKKKKKKKKKEKEKERKKKKNEGGGEVEEMTESKKRKRDDEVDQELSEGKKGKEREKFESANEIGDTTNGEKRILEMVDADESEIKKVYVGGIPYYSTEDDIKSYFENCGTVTEVDCMTFPESGKFRGIAFLTFKTDAAAKRALALNGSDMGGFQLKVELYKAKRTQRSSDFAPKIVEGYNRVYVGNLAYDITEDDLRNLFSDCKVSSIRFGTDKATGDFMCYAHVDFEDTVSLTLALKLDQKVVCGRPVKISCAVPPKKGVDVNSQKKAAATQKEESQETGGSSKKTKRRTCYECGVPGHLSSACPRKKAAKGDGSGDKS